MYCPKCFSDSITMNPRGVVHISINGMHMDSGRFLYNCARETPEEIKENFLKKLEEFFKWYSTFQNKASITVIQTVSSDFYCESKCKLDIGSKFSILDILIPYDVVDELLKSLGKKYNLDIKIHD